MRGPTWASAAGEPSAAKAKPVGCMPCWAHLVHMRPLDLLITNNVTIKKTAHKTLARMPVTRRGRNTFSSANPHPIHKKTSDGRNVSFLHDQAIHDDASPVPTRPHRISAARDKLCCATNWLFSDVFVDTALILAIPDMNGSSAFHAWSRLRFSMRNTPANNTTQLVAAKNPIQKLLGLISVAPMTWTNV
jgi:hypothetical protein